MELVKERAEEETVRRLTAIPFGLKPFQMRIKDFQSFVLAKKIDFSVEGFDSLFEDDSTFLSVIDSLSMVEQAAIDPVGVDECEPFAEGIHATDAFLQKVAAGDVKQEHHILVMSWFFIQRVLKAGFEIGIGLAFENTDRFVMSMKRGELR